MPRSRSRARCDRTRRPSLTVRAAEDALELLLAASSADGEPGVAALLLDRHHRVLCVVTGTDAPGHGVHELCEALAELCGHAEVTAVCLATVEPDAPVTTWPLDHEARWSMLEATLDEGRIRLLDWFVIIDDVALSISELVLDRDPPWEP